MRQERLGFIGLGMMGSAMAEMLLKAGHALTVWNREPEGVQKLAGLGAEPAASPAAVAARSDIVFLCVLDGRAVRDVVLGKDGVAEGARSGTLVVDHSTVMPQETREITAAARQQAGIEWLDAPVSGGPGFAREKRLTVMAGGSGEAFERARPLLDAFAANVTHIGPLGSGQAAKVINQAISGVSYVLMAEVVRLAEESGLDAGNIPQCLSGGHADSTMLHFAYPRMLAKHFEPPASLAGTVYKDLCNVGSEASRLGLSLPLIEAATARFSDYVEAGGGASDTSSIYRLYRPQD